MKWDLSALRKHVRSQGDDSEFALTLVASIDRYILIYRYHLYKARDAMSGIAQVGTDSDESHSLRYVFGSADNQAQYNEAKIENEANLLASIHSVRAMYEIFAQLVNSLVLSGHYSVPKCTIYRVAKALPESVLRQEINELTSHYWFQWLSDFVNTIKHRRLMTHTFTLHVDNPSAEILVDGFEYEGREYPAYTDTEILKGTLEVKNKIVDCGNALNRILLTDV